MKFGIRAKLFVVSVGVIVASFLVAYVSMSTQLTRMFTQKIADDLSVRAALVGLRAGEETAPLDEARAWVDLARSLSKRAGARVTLIRRDGVVLGDSGVAPDRVPELDNHANRPEIQQALREGLGQSARYSASLDRQMHYVAVPFHRDGQVVGTARLAMAMTDVDTALARLREALTVATLIALLLAVLMSSVAAHLMSRRALALAGAARRMAEGDLTTRVGLTGGDEFGELGRSLDRMTKTLSATVERVREERDRLGGIIAGMQEGFMMLDHAGRIELVNPALREMLLLGAEAEGKQPSEAIQHPELNRLLTLARSSGEVASLEMELSGIKPRIVLARAGPLAGQAGGVFCMFVDVTEMRRLETLRRDFVANVSHELRTPVTAIRSGAETLQNAMARDPAAAGMFVDIIDRNAARLQSLVEDLLDLSRIESRELDLDLEEVDLYSLFGQVIELFRERADKKQIQLLRHVPDGLPPAHGDRDALENVLANLVDNAVKYCGPGSEVALRAAEDGDGLRVFVEDTGPGIDAAHLPRLFERFYRVDAGRSRELGGTGLGLSIVKHLVEGLGGTVRVESTPGEGTQFSFTITSAEVAQPPSAD